MRITRLATLAMVLMWAPAGEARPGPDEPGLLKVGYSEPGQATPAWDRTRATRGLSRLTLRAAYDHGFHEGLGWTLIFTGASLGIWSYTSFRVAAEAFKETDSLLVPLATMTGGAAVALGIMLSGFGISTTITGTYLAARHHGGGLPGLHIRQAHSAGLVRGMGLGLAVQGAST